MSLTRAPLAALFAPSLGVSARSIPNQDIDVIESLHRHPSASPIKNIPMLAAHLASDHGHEEHHHDHDHDLHSIEMGGHHASCGHSRVEDLVRKSVASFTADIKALNIDALRARRHLSESYPRPQTIRISTQYQLSPQLSPSQAASIRLFVNTAVKIAQKFISVLIPLTTPLQVRPNALCSPASIPYSLRAGRGGMQDTDLVLFVTSDPKYSCGSSSNNSNVAEAIAWAMSCDYSLETSSLGRPIMAVINLCPSAISAISSAASSLPSSDPNAPQIAVGGILDVLTHEMVHALGLTSSMYSTWIGHSSNPVVSSKGVPYLTTPQSSEEAQLLLGCSTLPGAPLESLGTAASTQSHWEFRFFSQELMTPLFLNSSRRQRLSKLTLSALYDTGW